MHPIHLPAPFAELLYSTSIPNIRPVIRIEAYAALVTGYDAAGKEIFTPSYLPAIWMDTSRVIGVISDARSMPVLPEDGTQLNEMRAGEMSITFDNTDGRFSWQQATGIFDINMAEQARFTIYQQVGNDPANIWRIYSGRMVGLPRESRTSTTITIRDIMWEMARTPLVFDKITPGQQAYISGADTFIPGFTEINPGPHSLKLYDGIVAFSEDGFPLTSITRSKETIDVKRITIQNKSKLGKYTLEFVSSNYDGSKWVGGFKVLFPDNDIIFGTTEVNFGTSTSGSCIFISSDDWILNEDPKGAKIEFTVRYAGSGDGITAAMVLIERAHLKNWGVMPTFPASLPVDWESFIEAQKYYSHVKISFSETNADNKVFENKLGNRPISCLQQAQRELNHVGCKLVIDDRGYMKLYSPEMATSNPGTLSDSAENPFIIEHEILASDRSNLFRAQFAKNDLTGDYTSKIIKDRKVFSSDEEIELTLSFPYFRRGSYAGINSVFTRMVDRILKNYMRISLVVTPNAGFALVPGDVVKIQTITPPRLNGWFQIYSVGRNIGGNCSCELIAIDEPVLNVSRFCEAVFCEDVFS